MEGFLEKVHFGLNARLQIGRLTEKQHMDNAEFHKKELKRLSEECKEVLLRHLQGLQYKRYFNFETFYYEHFFMWQIDIIISSSSSIIIIIIIVIIILSLSIFLSV